jgi:hypothetical protein
VAESIRNLSVTETNLDADESAKHLARIISDEKTTEFFTSLPVRDAIGMLGKI